MACFSQYLILRPCGKLFDEESVAEIEAERIEVANKEAVFALVDLVKRLGLIGFNGRNRPFKHGLSVRRSTLRECRSREQGGHGAERANHEFTKHGYPPLPTWHACHARVKVVASAQPARRAYGASRCE